MNGLILLKDYTYEGNIFDGLPHGKGRYYFHNGDKYTGRSSMGKITGYGIFDKKSVDQMFQGYFLDGQLNGLGTYETKDIICKGQWFMGKKNGKFYHTDKLQYKTSVQYWRDNLLIKNHNIQYKSPNELKTIEKIHKDKKPLTTNIKKSCIGCLSQRPNATNDNCGHVIMCSECLFRCDSCPVCRAPIGKLIKLYF